MLVSWIWRKNTLVTRQTLTDFGWNILMMTLVSIDFHVILDIPTHEWSYFRGGGIAHLVVAEFYIHPVSARLTDFK